MVLPKGTWPSVIPVIFLLRLLLVSFTEFPRAEHRRRRPHDAHRGALDQHLGDEARTGTQAPLEAPQATERSVQLRVMQRRRDKRKRGEPDRVEELHEQLHEDVDPEGRQRRLRQVLIVELSCDHRPIPPELSGAEEKSNC